MLGPFIIGSWNQWGVWFHQIKIFDKLDNMKRILLCCMNHTYEFIGFPLICKSYQESVSLSALTMSMLWIYQEVQPYPLYTNSAIDLCCVPLICALWMCADAEIATGFQVSSLSGYASQNVLCMSSIFKYNCLTLLTAPMANNTTSAH